MLSSDAHGVASWVRWSKTTISLCPEQPGVYIFRMAGGNTPIKRLNGCSDIVYIGSTPKGGTVRSRLRDHRMSRKDQKCVGGKIERVLKEVGPLEVGWKIFSRADQAANHESEILWRYGKDHIELPPLNSQTPQRTDRLNEDWVRQDLSRLSGEEVANLLSALDPTKLQEIRARLVTMGKLAA